jgi:hypothetical protein
VPVGLFRDGKKRKRRAAARARAAYPGRLLDDRRGRPNPLATGTDYTASPGDARDGETDDFLSAHPGNGERY